MDWRISGHRAFVAVRALQIVNWVRLGLVSVDYYKTLTVEERYAWVDGNPQVIRLRREMDAEELKRVEIQKGVLETTAFGEAFHKVVMQPEVPASEEGQ